MSEQDKTQVDADVKSSVSLKGLVLQRLEFERCGPSLPENKPDTFDVKFSIGVKWPDGDTLPLEFNVLVEVNEVLRAAITYRAEFQSVGQHPNVEQYWRIVASRIAPQTIYPYARETFSSLAAKAGAGNITLPIVNVGRIFSPDEIAFESEDEEKSSGEA